MTDVAHDLRNLLGLVRTMAAGLVPLLGDASSDAQAAAAELDAHTQYALEALRIVEKWDDPSPLDVHLGAWGWALRLASREVMLGELLEAGRAQIVLPQALAAGVVLVAAMGRTVRVEIAGTDGGLCFEAASRAARPDALAAALGALAAAGLQAVVVRDAPCRVEVRGA
jgi:hypothetical protein